jgi:hypothetical protein
MPHDPDFDDPCQHFAYGPRNDFEQVLDTPTANRRDNPELRKMRSDRVDGGSLLADQKMARAMKHLSRATEVVYEFCVRRRGPSDLYTKTAPAAFRIIDTFGKTTFATWGNSGIEPDKGKGISSPGTYEASLMWPRNDGERQWNTMSGWTYR